ncbi:hypothetical protein B0T17DRAFT_533586 [Bombardia bombarda]|uniref:Uncharacterized protein n=1 Tax=Bombardia bombarda TaxID=252184 RepID=A0AA40C1H7_9PEZI|nr:hypothetical protein B0T17DRAFT_533586 [Bombardia bombarda]
MDGSQKVSQFSLVVCLPVLIWWQWGAKCAVSSDCCSYCCCIAPGVCAFVLVTRGSC